jgi:arylsulfatase A-like enzyme
MLGIPDVAAPTDEAAMRRLRSQYYGMIGDVDEQIGRTLDALDQRGLTGDTVVILTADHGDQLGDHGLLGKLGWHEESYRIPAVVADPRRPSGWGTRVTLPTENVDLLPTLCELIGAEVPLQCDGTSLVPFLDGPDTPEAAAATADWRRGAVWEFDWRALAILMGGVTDRSLESMNLAVWRSEEVAYVQFGDGSWLAADLAADPSWRTPLTDPERVLAAAREMLVWRSRHLDRTLSGTVLLGRPLGRPVGAARPATT